MKQGNGRLKRKAFWPLAVRALLLTCVGSTLAQTPSNFVVATVKSVSPDTDEQQITSVGGDQVRIDNFTVVDLIRYAYGQGYARYFQVRGGPAWIGKARYVVLGKSPAPLTPAGLKPLVRGLLTERFGLNIHHEQRESKVYKITFARADKKLGPKMSAWKGTCDGRIASPGEDPKRPVCRAQFGSGGLSAVGISVEGLADMLSFPATWIDRQVVDGTGLQGYFNVELEFQPQYTSSGQHPTSDTGPSIFTALKEQLGLKLRSGKAKVDVIVVDSVERPTEN